MWSDLFEATPQRGSTAGAGDAGEGLRPQGPLTGLCRPCAHVLGTVAPSGNSDQDLELKSGSATNPCVTSHPLNREQASICMSISNLTQPLMPSRSLVFESSVARQTQLERAMSWISNVFRSRNRGSGGTHASHLSSLGWTTCKFPSLSCVRWLCLNRNVWILNKGGMEIHEQSSFMHINLLSTTPESLHQKLFVS